MLLKDLKNNNNIGEKMIELKWMKDYNIINRYIMKLGIISLTIVWITVSIIIYPLICMFYNSSDIRDEIKGAFKFLFEK